MALRLNEEALLFGRRRSLVGVVTEPGLAETDSRRAGVVILNAGALHRVGPNRLHVQFARALARSGFTVVRFDLSGIGDSLPRRGSQAFVESRGEEVAEAIDLLATGHGLDRFLVIGICSGADGGLDAALADPRIAGAVLIDGYNVPSLGYALHLYRRSFLSLQGWGRLLTGRSKSWGDLRRFLRPSPGGPSTSAPVSSAPPSRTEYLHRVRTVLDRGAHLLLIYSAQSPAYFNYHGLLKKRARLWRSRDRLSVECLEDSDHTFTLLCNQRRLVTLVHDWAVGLPLTDSGSRPPR